MGLGARLKAGCPRSAAEAKCEKPWAGFLDRKPAPVTLLLETAEVRPLGSLNLVRLDVALPAGVPG